MSGVKGPPAQQTAASITVPTMATQERPWYLSREWAESGLWVVGIQHRGWDDDRGVLFKSARRKEVAREDAWLIACRLNGTETSPSGKRVACDVGAALNGLLASDPPDRIFWCQDCPGVVMVWGAGELTPPRCPECHGQNFAPLAWERRAARSRRAPEDRRADPGDIRQADLSVLRRAAAICRRYADHDSSFGAVAGELDWLVARSDQSAPDDQSTPDDSSGERRPRHGA